VSTRLSRAAALDPAPLTAGDSEVDGLDVSAPLGSGRDAFAAARERLATWVTHRSLMMAIDADGRSDQLGTTVLLGLGLGPARVWFGCRLVEVIDEDARAGYAYATLPGHPAHGVERFTITLGSDGAVMGRVQAWSQPGWRVLALAGPAARLGQRTMARQYLRRLTGTG